MIVGFLKVMLVIFFNFFLLTGVMQTVISFIAYSLDKRFVNYNITKVSVYLYQLLGTYSFGLIGAFFAASRLKLSSDFVFFCFLLYCFTIVNYFTILLTKRMENI